MSKQKKQELLEIYSQRELSAFDPKAAPAHIAIIPDGNRRWAKRSLFNTEKGHRAGAHALTRVVNAARLLGTKVVTVYTLSTENWKRPKREINLLLSILQDYLISQRPDMLAKGIRLETIGDLTPFPKELIAILNETKQLTANGRGITLVLALNYGGRDEIRRAIHTMIDDCQARKIKKEELTIETIGSYMDTAPWGDPDLLIRTSGEQRISNFLLWQISYTEIYNTQVLWPDFSPKHLLDAFIDYQKRERRGGT
jgi:undecaprenyl diphosphate synthase